MVGRTFEPTWKHTPDIASITVTDSASNVLGQMQPDMTATLPDRMSTWESPKLSFNFVCQFYFEDNIIDIGRDSNGPSPLNNKFAVIRAGRPQPTFNYTKVNFYNFRTNVATSVDYGTVNLSFYDDSANRAHDIAHTYLNAMSPISNVNSDSANNLDTLGQNLLTDLQAGPPAPGTDRRHSASLGPLKTRRHGIIKRIRITHLYRVGESGREAATYYDYLNPKLTSLTLGELDMSQSVVNTVDMTFNYDSVYTTKVILDQIGPRQ